MWHHGSINRAYRLVFNRARGTWAVAPETARGQGKAAAAVGGATATGRVAFSPRQLRLAILAGLGLLTLPSLSFALDAGALPSGGQVIAGQADIGQSGTSLTVNQGSDRAIIDWQSFDIGKDAAVRFNQPGAHAAALNRVTGGSRSQILGNLSANGQVYLVNGAGVLFGQSAQVDVGGIVASTLAISNEDFLAGKDRFTLTENSTGEVINQGSITATSGTVALLGKNVSNTGSIQADGGNVLLAAGREITFAAGADGHLQIAVDASELQLAVHNGGAIVADGGQIVLNAQGANALASAVVSNSGTLQARTLAEREGRILLLADLDSGGRAEVAGALDASAPASANPKGGNGGFVETSAAKVGIAADTRVSTKAEQGQTGTWLIDPTDFTVAAGSATQTNSGIGAETLNANLATTSVTLQTVATGSEAGDINVDAAVAWSADTTLTLNAHGDININAAITATGDSAGLVLNHGGYAQDGSATSGSDYHVNAPVTLSGANASLSINGDAYTLIHSMTQLDAIDSTGLGGRYALAKDLDASGTTYDRAVVGSTFTGIFAGLGHSISDLTIESAHGHLGLFGSTGTDALIRDIGLLGGSVTGTGTGYNYLGGLVGYNYGGTISNAYATGSVTGTGTGTYNYLGGLIGYNVSGGAISNVYATGSVSGSGTYNYLGGLVGYNDGTISNAYATGSVSGSGTYNYLGGLVGYNDGTISNAYATGSVNGSGTYNLGGLVGINYGTISNAHWDSGSTGQAQAVGTGTSATNTTDIAANRYAHTAYASFGTWSEDAPGVWVARDADGAPQWVMLEGSTRPFLYSEYSTSIGNAHQLQLMALDLTATYTLAADIDASATDGSNASGMWSTAGFDPIGDASNAFTGSLDGQGHVVFELSINRASESYVGLIGQAGSGSSIRDIGLTDAEVNGGDYVGVLVGSNSGSIGNAWSSGSVSSGGSNIGGLAGSNQASGSIDEASSAAEVAGGNVTGGLVGQNHGSITGSHASGSVTATTDNIGGLVGWSGGSIDNAHASGSVTGRNNVGGLVGGNSGSIDDAYASGSVSSSGSGTNNDLGGLVGYNDGGTISNAYATGSVTSSDVNNYLGGLVGYNNYGTITNAYATGSVSGSGTSTTNYLGGLVGYNYGGTISNAYATGSVTGTGANNYLGGLVGINVGNISNAYATGSVNGTGTGTNNRLGGLVGNNVGTITNAYATGSVNSTGTGTGTYNHLGGLVGYNNNGTITNAYATGSMTGTGANNYLGGLVGYNYSGTISNAYATGSMTGSGTNNILGGLVGYNGGTISDAFYATTDANGNLINSGSGYNALGTAKTLAELQDLSTFAAWGSDIDAQGGSGSVWRIYDGYTTPLLRSFLTQVTVSADLSAAGKTYDGSAASGTSSYTTDLTGASLDGSLSYATDSKNAGTYSTVDGNLIFDGLYSGQQGYDIRYANAELAIDKADLTVTGLSANNKTYDGTAAAALTGTASVTAIGTDVIVVAGTGTGTFNDKNAGTDKTVTVTGYTLSGTDADNYNLLQPTGLTATINKAQATITANSANVTYNGQQQSVSGFTASGMVNGESESVLTGVTTSGGSGTNAGSYLLTASGSDGNYALTFV
ncbi:GLUG motif-containing protein, partial [Stutzerimonas kirkiae]|uniref:GLUG motif-containing protein n=1 Tax=Stutzerimonas kirkiae TaxID=2211392 RepID=UPI00103844CA